MSTDGQIDKENVVHMYNTILCNLKKKEILSYATTWMNLEDITVPERSWSQEDKYCTIHLHEVPRVVRFRDRNWGGGRQGLGEGGREFVFNGDGVSVWGDGKFQK